MGKMDNLSKAILGILIALFILMAVNIYCSIQIYFYIKDINRATNIELSYKKERYQSYISE